MTNKYHVSNQICLTEYAEHFPIQFEFNEQLIVGVGNW